MTNCLNTGGVSVQKELLPQNQVFLQGWPCYPTTLDRTYTRKSIDRRSKVEFRPYIDCDGSTFDPPMSLHFAYSVPEDSGEYLSTIFPAIAYTVVRRANRLSPYLRRKKQL